MGAIDGSSTHDLDSYNLLQEQLYSVAGHIASAVLIQLGRELPVQPGLALVRVYLHTLTHRTLLF